MSIQRPIAGFRFVEVQRGDTLQRIAAREFGDAARWPELVGYNGLRAPFVTDDPAQAGSGVILSGQLIRVPASSAVISAEASPEEVFGRDVFLRVGRVDVSNGDFAVAGGIANLKQALQHRLDTDRGELLFHRDYGSLVRMLVGTVVGPTASLLAAQYAKAAMLSDPRVSLVSRAEAEVIGDVINVNVEVKPVTGKTIDVSATV